MSTTNSAPQWHQWMQTHGSTRREPGDLISSDEVDQPTLSHMRLPRSRSSLEDDEEGDDICMQMQTLRGMPECPPFPGGFLAPPRLRRAGHETPHPLPRLQAQDSLDKSTSSVRPTLGRVEELSSRGAALSDPADDRRRRDDNA